MTVASVQLWGVEIGAVVVDDAGSLPAFQYTPEFARTGIQVAPARMPLRRAPYSFPELVSREAFIGLPGLLADSLPDRWGRTLISAWLASQGRTDESFDAVERLCYTGTRGMGALEFLPSTGPSAQSGVDLDVGLLVQLASEAIAEKEQFEARLSADPTQDQMAAILSIGTSAGGARPKAVIAYNETTGQVRSGQVPRVDPGFTHWLLKFDGVDKAGDHGLADPTGWGAVEYAYWMMATHAGIDMTESRLLKENGRRHFMTRRFDRADDGEKIHVQTIAALDYADYNDPSGYSYEQAFAMLRTVGLDVRAADQLFRRMVFNVLARNQDDHVKNTALLMDQTGAWRLSPAYDLTWSHKPGNRWLGAHQMSINGKREAETITREDLRAVSKLAGLKQGRYAVILDEVAEAVSNWMTFAEAAEVDERTAEAARDSHLLIELGS